ncbi:hypothetical protein MRBBS_0298 [Marinobacter sp. BSs20148]|nr:hypothetical protein MRBBS_0298 [Marinobacter sp. BSs20148]
MLLPHGFQAVGPFFKLHQQVSGRRVNQPVGLKHFEPIYQT